MNQYRFAIRFNHASSAGRENRSISALQLVDAWTQTGTPTKRISDERISPFKKIPNLILDCPESSIVSCRSASDAGGVMLEINHASIMMTPTSLSELMIPASCRCR